MANIPAGIHDLGDAITLDSLHGLGEPFLEAGGRCGTAVSFGRIRLPP